MGLFKKKTKYYMIHADMTDYGHIINQFSEIEKLTLEYIEILYGVIAIEKNSFSDMENLKELIIPSSCNVIEAYAFKNCIKLEKIDFSPVVSEFSIGVFDNCQNLKILNNISQIKKINRYAFNNCTSLEYINLDNVTFIGEEAFSNCKSLKYLEIKNANNIGKDIAKGCNLDYAIIPNKFKNNINEIFPSFKEIIEDENLIRITF